MNVVKINRITIFFIFIFCLCLMAYLIIFFDSLDSIWIYGNSLKISEGYLPYRDFNLVTTPLFYWIIAFFCKLISYHIVVCLIIGALINTLIYYLCYRISVFILQDKYKALWVIAIIFSYTVITMVNFTYNSLALLFILLIVLIEFKKIRCYSIKNHLLIGLLLGGITLTKHSTGFVATLMSFTYLLFAFDSNKEKILAIFWRGFALFLVLLIFVIYLMVTDSLVCFINYAILGLKDFSEENQSLNSFTLLYFAPIVLCFIMALYRIITQRQNLYIKSLFFYSVSALSLCIPIFDFNHVSIAGIPFLLLIIFLTPIKQMNLNYKLMVNVSLLLGIGLVYSSFKTSNNWMIYHGSPDYFSGSVIKRDNYEQLTKVTHYIQEKEKAGFNVIIVDVSGMVYFLTMGKINAPYDYLINGNLGKNGQQRIINEFNDKPENTLYLIKNNLVNQDVEQVKLMIVNNYKQIDKIGSFLVYQQPQITNE